MTNTAKEAPYTFRVSKTHGNIRKRDCEHCGKRTGQQQAQDANGKWVEKFRCMSCLRETS